MDSVQDSWFSSFLAETSSYCCSSLFKIMHYAQSVSEREGNDKQNYLTHLCSDKDNLCKSNPLRCVFTKPIIQNSDFNLNNRIVDLHADPGFVVILHN